MIQKIKELNPLIHHITNFVTAKLCANVTLAIGASPLMADEEDEMKEISLLSNALVINLGTLNYRTLDSAIDAIGHYTDQGKPVVLDPVGIGASRFRTSALNELLRGGKINLIKGNAGEIASIIGVPAHSKGVDSLQEISEEFLKEATYFAEENDLTLAISGPKNYVLSEGSFNEIKGGSPLCAKITGAGCALASLMGAHICVGPAHHAAVSAFLAFSIASKKAEARAKTPASFELALLDELFLMSDEAIKENAKLL